MDVRISEQIIQRCPGAKIEPAELRGCLGEKVLHHGEGNDDPKNQQSNPWRRGCDNDQRPEKRQSDSALQGQLINEGSLH